MKTAAFADLPEWFDLSRYDDVRLFTLDDWLINLGWRASFFDWHPGLTSNFRTEIEDRFEDRNGHELIAKRSSPYDWSGETTPDGHPMAYPALRTSTVRSLEVWNIVSILSWASEDEYELSIKLREQVERIESLDQSRDDQLFLNEPFDLLERKEVMGNDYGDVRAEIDLLAPDDIILEDFKEWLGSAREVFGFQNPGRFSSAQLARWTENRILPYIDLALWAKLNKRRITYAVLGSAIFPDDPDGNQPDRIRRTTKPLAHRLMRHEMIEAMVRQLRATA